MKTKCLIIALALISGEKTLAQHARFSTEGTIEFEKSVNLVAVVKKAITKDNEWYYVPALESYQRSNPQFVIRKSTLTYSKNKTLFTPIEPETQATHAFSSMPHTKQINTVYTDLAASKSVTQKEVFEQTYLVSDSTRRINWKLTSETREIAGYHCRRANALIMDSIYVVAFYTDEIPISGGPESFTGLPGMILGVALPYENTTWFAKIVHDKPLATPPVPPKKGKASNVKELDLTLKGVMKRWGGDAMSQLKIFLL